MKSVQEKAKNVESHGDDEEDELALLIKNFHKLLKKAGKQMKSGSLVLKHIKVKILSNLLIFLTIKMFNVESEKGYGHIQFECANTCKKKSKDMTSV